MSAFQPASANRPPRNVGMNPVRAEEEANRERIALLSINGVEEIE